MAARNVLHKKLGKSELDRKRVYVPQPQLAESCKAHRGNWVIPPNVRMQSVHVLSGGALCTAGRSLHNPPHTATATACHPSTQPTSNFLKFLTNSSARWERVAV